ncbi:sirohydrochlorin chelatase [Candidatus Nitrosotalea okcheonensis]|uniref:Cobalamin (Vitamin B12) biosynthesis CbiX protein n=1 Tax=Candidatus Nitrosotalea okcheonensis TaxID=1903276 RepID=A0A2H1FHF0_9ARCH|nr:CbiX/SirB N-terminal domain-containing protein [Candidatus Nitrosotalea okcheonensis]SMH72188.1 Cobalamin (Vitamin B12) biosynthesis CbiX protein [Candidatus Nitrosotalea okcheonensis]
MKRGLLLIDRGSKEREASEELEIICKEAKKKGGYAFAEYCFLEVTPPYIDDGIKKCLKSDIDSLTIVPYFLYPGKKVKAAVTEVIKYQSATNVKFLVTKPMSMHMTLVNLVRNRIKSALDKGKVLLPDNKIDVLVIGHGSKDPNAKMSIKYVVDELGRSYRNVDYCFLEIEEPNIEQGIQMCKKRDPEVLVVVFYFLHEGAHVKTDINADLKPALEKHKLNQVLITQHLGTDQKMVDLIIERAQEVET